MNSDNPDVIGKDRELIVSMFDGDTKRHSHLVYADALIGKNVRNKRAERIGEIKSLVVDVLNGGVMYAVLEQGGFFGIGAKLFAVPWSVLKLNVKRDFFIFDISKEDFRKAPSFDSNQWSGNVDLEWMKKIDVYYKSVSRSF